MSSLFRHDWTLEEASKLYHQPFMDLILQAQQLHRQHFSPNTVQISTLQNIKVGGCPEDCKWCGQSTYNKTGVENEPMADLNDVRQKAALAKANGATRYCLSASWRKPTNRNLAKVIEMVKAIKALDMEACITVGKLNPEQAATLKEAGLDYYNHNLETSEQHFKKVSTTQCYQDRLDTLEYVRQAGINVCSGGLLGMGESTEDRINLLITLANQSEHPQSVPINQLVKIKDTPLEEAEPIENFDFIRCVALARMLMPKAYVRLSGGRVQMSPLMQTLCFLAGANSIHYGNQHLLVTKNVEVEKDINLFKQLGLETQLSSQSNSLPYKTFPIKTIHENTPVA